MIPIEPERAEDGRIFKRPPSQILLGDAVPRMTGPTNYGPTMMGGLHKSLIGWGWWAEGWGSQRRSGWAFTEQTAAKRRDAALAAMKPRADEIVVETRRDHVRTACPECFGRGWVFGPCPDADYWFARGSHCTVLHTEPCPSCSADERR